ncbi:MAG: ABC transporter permease [Peptoniphilaceae bacterium]|nr:ABC transporter permease [Peptoniphilaceae bacterium]MDD7383096.1 ABC transporter permease [Peptoniphilaceae bacterium]MDY3737531.1 ABC transporter permease [Peptoniphilaceae bacterium]
MNRLNTVAKETWKEQIKSVSFWIMALLPIILGIIMGIVLYFMANKEYTSTDVGIIAQKEIFDMIPSDENTKYKLMSEKEAKRKIKNGDIQSFAEIENKNNHLKVKYHGESDTNPEFLQFKAKIDSIQQQLNFKSANLTTREIEEVTTMPSIDFINSAKNQINDVLAGFLLGFTLIFYFIVIIYSQIMMIDVAKEKGTKMLEFMFSNVKPKVYFGGKILGIIYTLLTNILVYVVGFVITFFEFKMLGIIDELKMLNIVQITNDDINKMLIITGFMVFGILAYTIFSAILGSLVSKFEDAQKLSTPVMILIVGTYFLALYQSNGNTNKIVEYVSYLPFFSSFMAPINLMKGVFTINQSLIALLILVVFTVLFYFFGTYVYKKKILYYKNK